jgi:hypothetical protein
MVSATSLTGAAGEHFVMSELLRRGMIAALAPAGVPNCDIVVTDEIGDRLCAVQVKTRLGRGADRGWHMRRKHEELIAPSLFYCFVDFGVEAYEAPVTYVVPAAVVAACLAENHRVWLDQPGAKGQAHNDNEMRRFKPDYSNLRTDKYQDGWLKPYREAWTLLQRKAS